MCDTFVILNLQYFKWDSYISVICRASLIEDGRKTDAVTHLAVARSQNTENGILGDLQKRKAVAKAAANFCLFLQKVLFFLVSKVYFTYKMY